MKNPLTDEEMDEKDVVYSEMYPPFTEPTFVQFVPRSVAEAMVTLGKVRSAETWGDLKQRLPAYMYEALRSLHEDSNEFQEVKMVGEPPPDMSFYALGIPGREAGFWPLYLSEYQMDWMPDDIQDKYGGGGITDVGLELLFECKFKDQIVKELTAKGYKCTEDESMVSAANWARQ